MELGVLRKPGSLQSPHGTLLKNDFVDTCDTMPKENGIIVSENFFSTNLKVLLR